MKITVTNPKPDGPRPKPPTIHGYQPTQKLTTDPPQGGSGVPTMHNKNLRKVMNDAIKMNQASVLAGRIADDLKLGHIAVAYKKTKHLFEMLMKIMVENEIELD